MIAVIKPGTLRIEPGTVLKSGDYQSLAQVRDLLDIAQREHDGAKASIDAAYADAQERGHEEGRRRSELEMARRHIELVRSSVAWLGGLEGDLAEAVTAALHKIVDEIGPRDVLLAMIRKSLAGLQGRQQLKILANGGTLEHLRQNFPDSAEVSVTFAEAPQLGEGKATIESPVGIMRIDLDGMLDQFSAAIRGGPEEGKDSKGSDD